MPEPLPLCVIGAGLIGMRHVEVAAASDRVDLTAVVEPSEALRSRLVADGYPAVASLDEVPAGTRAAIVATPTQAHYQTAMDALGKGMAVLVEKPLTGTLDEGRALLAAADRAGLPLVTGHHRRCHPFVAAMVERLRDIGEPVGIQALWSLRKHASYYDVDWRRKPGAGPLMTNLSHEIDLAQLFFGTIAQVSALTSNARRGLGVEDTAALSLRFESGALGSVLISDAGASPWAFEAATNENPGIAASGEDYLRVTGTRGALAFPSLTRWSGDHLAEIEWRQPLTRQQGPTFEKIDPIAAQLDRFAAVAAGGSDDLLCTGAQGLAATEVTLATLLSAKRGRPIAIGDVPGDYPGD